MPSSDSVHQYIFKSGEYGSFYQFWWKDRLGNYYRYTNADPNHPDFDPFWGQPLIDPEQPLIEKNPEFFSKEGFLLHVAPPTGVEIEQNPNYNPQDPKNLWYGVFKDVSGLQYVYLDRDVKENLDLYIQHQIRVTDVGLPKFRLYATQLFTGKHIKDRLTGLILMLCDQGFFEPEELVEATVGDISFVDQTVVLLGRKLLCDLRLFDMLTSLVAKRAPTEPLFEYETRHGKKPVGVNYINSVFYSLKVSPKFLLSWNASHMFSRIVNRMLFEQVPAEEVETRALGELARALSTREDVRHLVDYKVLVALMRNYEQAMVGEMQEAPTTMKSLTHLAADDFGIAVIRSDLSTLRPDEKEFSTWLHSTPMHDTSPAIEQAIDEAMAAQEPTEPTPGAEPAPASPDDVEDSAQEAPAEEVPQ